MDTREAIRTKRAIRSFTEQPLSPEQIEAILEAGRRAPSARNLQPWTFLAVTDRERLKALAQAAVYGSHMAGAALAVLLIGPESHWALFDSGQAAAYMQLAAWDLGIASCVGAFEDPEKGRPLLQHPADQTILALVSFGFPHPQDAHRPLQPGGRKPLAEVVRWNHW